MRRQSSHLLPSAIVGVRGKWALDRNSSDGSVRKAGSEGPPRRGKTIKGKVPTAIAAKPQKEAKSQEAQVGEEDAPRRDGAEVEMTLTAARERRSRQEDDAQLREYKAAIDAQAHIRRSKRNKGRRSPNNRRQRTCPPRRWGVGRVAAIRSAAQRAAIRSWLVVSITRLQTEPISYPRKTAPALAYKADAPRTLAL